MPTISDRAANALRGAVARRGKNRGYLLAKCPNASTDAAAAWQGAVMVCNPYKVSIGSIMFMSSEQREIFEEVKTVLEATGVRRLDRDRDVLEQLGVWP